MSNANCSCFKLSIVTLILLAEVVFAGTVYGQSAPSIRVGGVEVTGVPDDWTHHHVIFANPGTEQDAIESGHYAQWQKIVNEPRYVIQQLKKGLPVQGPAAADAEYRARWISQVSGVRTPEALQIGGSAIELGPRIPRRIIDIGRRVLPPSEIDRDWSMTSGGTGGLAAGHYPAKYSFLPTTASKTTESCSDYVAFPTGIQGSSTQATLVAYNNLYKTTCGSTIPGTLLSINTGGVASTSPLLSLDGTQVAFVQSAPGTSLTVNTTSGSKNFTVTSGTLTAGEVGQTVSGTGIPLYDTVATRASGTSGTLANAATVTGTTTLTLTGVAQLVLVKIGSGGGTAVSSPLSPAAVTNAAYPTCTAPCYTTFTFHTDASGTTPSDSNSAPFYVYNDITNGNPDILYAGDDLGYVHKFSPVFSGTATTPPAEVTTNWPFSASTETTPALDSPVYDSTSTDIFVGDASGYLHQFTSGTTPGSLSTSGLLAHNTGGLVDGPIVAATTAEDYVFTFIGLSGDGAHNDPSYINIFSAASAINGQGSTYGTGLYFPNESAPDASTVMRAGDFDNTFYSGTGSTGNFYTCVNGVMYQIPLAGITTPTVNTYYTAVSSVADTSACSPITEFYDGTHDWLFTSVIANGNAKNSGGTTLCTGACVYNFNVQGAGTTGYPTAGLNETGGVSGIIIDNAASGGGSEIYFTSLGSESCNGVNGAGSTGNGTGSCAVQATQSGLQ
ncbi:MAG: hypothetical protein ACLPZY_20065 [Terracidiphilus sp.]